MVKEMKIRNSTISDLEQILSIYSNARIYMQNHGNPNQWYNYKPLEEDIIKDINNNIHYVIYENNIIYGCFTFFVGIDPTYLKIEGKWLNDEQYGVIHKVASSFLKKGILNECLNYCQKYINNLRIDTHNDNLTMQNALAKNGFVKCGTIYLADGSPRLAYQKTIRS